MPVPESPSLAFERAHGDAVLAFVEVRGRKPFAGEAAELRRSVAQKFLDRLPDWPAGTDRDEAEKIAAAALGGPFEER
jgi:hypothetical protein